MLHFPCRYRFSFSVISLLFFFCISINSEAQSFIGHRSYFNSVGSVLPDSVINPAGKDPTYIAIGAGFSSYSAPEILVLSAYVLPPLGQHVYIETGAEVYLINARLKYDGIIVSSSLSLNFNVKALHDRINIFFGGGAALYIPSFGIMPVVLARINYKLTRVVSVGLQIKEPVNFGYDGFYTDPLFLANIVFGL